MICKLPQRRYNSLMESFIRENDTMQAEMQTPLFTRKQLTRLIWPLLVEQLLSVLVGMVDVLMVSFVGEATVSGVSLVDSVNHLIIQVLFALTAGGTVVCARFIGAKDADGARKGAGQLLTITTAAMLALAALVLARRFWVGLYHLSAGSAELAAGLLLAHALAMVLWPAAFLLPYYFRATGRATFSMLVAVGAMAVFRIGFAYAFVMLLGKNVLWVWYAMFIDWVFRVAVFLPAFRKPKRE